MMKRLALTLLLFLAAPSASAQLALSDFVTPAGQQLVMAFVGVAGTPVSDGGSWPRLPWDPTDSRTHGMVGSIAEGNANLASDVTILAFRCANAGRCQARQTGAGFAAYFESPNPYDAGTWYWQDSVEVLTMSGADTSDARVGGGFYDFDQRDGADANAIATKMWNLTNGDRFILAFTLPAPADNCNMYLGSNDLTAPASLPLGASAPTRLYLGGNLVCGDAP